VAHIRHAASRVLTSGIHGKVDLMRAELAAAVMEETAFAIEAGDHWKELV